MQEDKRTMEVVLRGSATTTEEAQGSAMVTDEQEQQRLCRGSATEQENKGTRERCYMDEKRWCGNRELNR